jgi:hypothetical protein
MIRTWRTRGQIPKHKNDFEKNGWLVGCNYISSNTINQLEMWQEDKFGPELIEQEFGTAASLGFNTVRIFQ